MSNRTAKFVSAVLASLLAGTVLPTLAHSEVPAADSCLSGPKGQTPKGGHWYYRVDRATKRHCWYVGEEREKPAQSASSTQAAPAKAVTPEAETAMQPSIADARAELRTQAPVEQQSQIEAIPATPGAEAQSSLVASRWPDQLLADNSTNPTRYGGDPGTQVSSAEEAQPSSLLMPAQLLAADVSSQTASYSVQMLLAAIMGALALAAIMGSVIFKFGSTRRAQVANVRAGRGVNWEIANIESRTPPARPSADTRWTEFSRELDKPGDPNDRIAEFFSQLRGPT